MQADESKVKALESIFGGQDITASVIRTVLTSNENKFDDAVDSLLNMSNEIDSRRPPGVQKKEEELDEETLLDKKEREKINTLENMFGNDLSKSVICTVLESNKGELVDTVDTLLNMTSKDINPQQRRVEVNPRDSERMRQEEEIKNYEEFKVLQLRLQEEEAKAMKDAQRQAELDAREHQKRAEDEARRRALETARLEEAKRAADFAARAKAEAAAAEARSRKRAEEEAAARTKKETQEREVVEKQAREAAVAEQQRILREYEAAQKRKEEEQERLREAIADRVRQEERVKYQAQLAVHEQEKRANDLAQRRSEEEKRLQLEKALKHADEERLLQLEKALKRAEEERLQEVERVRLEEHKKFVEEESRLQARLHARQIEEEREVERQRRLIEEERTKMQRERERMEAMNEVMRKEQEERLRVETMSKAKLAEEARQLADQVKRLEMSEREQIAELQHQLEERRKVERDMRAKQQTMEEEIRRQEEQERLRREEVEQRRIEKIAEENRIAEEQKRAEMIAEEERKMAEKAEMEKIEEEERRKKANYDLIAASAIFIPPKSVVENAITVTATVDNMDIVCTWDLPDGTAVPTNWLGLYPVRQNNNKKYVQFVYTNGAGTGKHVFHNVTPGHYEVRFYTTKSYEQVASQSQTVRVGPVPTLGCQLQTDTLRVHYTLNPFSTSPASDWIGVYEKGQRRNKLYVSTMYGNSEGQVLMKAPRTPGAYEVRLFVNGSKYNEQAVADFVVEDNDCLRLEQTSTMAGNSANVAWVLRTVEPSTGDWIGVYKADEENNSNYLSCTYTQGLSVGQTAIQVPKEPGVYELRLFAKAKGKYVTFKTSEPLTVV